MIRAEGIAKHFGRTPVLSDMTFHVKRGERIALVGEDGRARRAMLRILGTIMRPNTGRLEIAGLDALEFPARVRSQLMWVGDTFCAGAQMEAAEYVRFVLSVRGVRLRDARAVSAALSRCGIVPDELMDRLPGGKRQLLDLTTVALVRPPLFLWDDVMQPPGRDGGVWRDIVGDIATAGTTIVCTTQADSGIATLCDRSVRIDRSVEPRHASLEYAVGAR